MSDCVPAETLPPILYIDAGAKTPSRVALDHPDQLQRSLSLGRKHYTGPVMALGDQITRSWLKRNKTPYKNEIFEVMGQAPAAGAIMLNLSFEWSCTTSAADNGDGGARLIRSLDWMLDGLGKETVVVSFDTEHGPYHNITWIGFVGVITAMAPGRFAAAINQPPMRRTSNIWPVDWLIEHKKVRMSDAMPPHHLLRQVFESCPDFATAKTMLTETPICIPAFFTLSGNSPDEVCCIERLETQAFVHENPATIANHWLDAPETGYDRGTDSRGRYVLMEAIKNDISRDPFNWVRPPILNATTRLAVVADAGLGDMLVRAYEADGRGSAEPATRDFLLSDYVSVAA